jgi:hypothetical protein
MSVFSKFKFVKMPEIVESAQDVINGLGKRTPDIKEASDIVMDNLSKNMPEFTDEIIQQASKKTNFTPKAIASGAAGIGLAGALLSDSASDDGGVGNDGGEQPPSNTMGAYDPSKDPKYKFVFPNDKVQQQPLSPLSNVEGTEEKGKPTGTQKRDTTTSAQGQQKSLKDYAQDPEVLNLFGLASEKPMVETEGTVENMKSAQQKRDDTILMNQLAMAGSTAANAMLQQDKPDLKFFEDNIKRAEDPIKDIETIVNTEKIDPNSDISQLYRDFAKEHLNMDLPMDASAQTIASLIPEIDKIAARDDRYKELMVRMKEASTARYNKQEEKNEMLNFNRTAKLRQESSSGSIGKIKDFYNTTDLDWSLAPPSMVHISLHRISNQK